MGGCSVKDCKSSSYKGMRLFRFPSNETRRKLWAKLCHREDWIPTTNARLCSLHFTEDQFENARVDGWRKLKPNAIPTIFQGTINDKSTNPVYFQKSQQVLLDHSYSGQNLILNRVRLSNSMIPDTPELFSKCAVASCSNTSDLTKKLNPDVSYHKFPQDEEVRNCWIKACDRKNAWSPSKSTVCSVHFCENDFEFDLRSLLFNVISERQLRKNAIPTLHLQKNEEIIIKVEQNNHATEEEEEIVIKCDPDERPNDYQTLYEDHEALKSEYDTLHESYMQQSREIECLGDTISQLAKQLEEERHAKQKLEAILRYIYSDQKKEK